MKFENVVIAVDFDGTCVTHEYPKMGQDIGAEPVLKRLIISGAKIILWTMRHGGGLADAIKWFEDRGIPLHGVNENPTQHEWTNSPKAYAHLYIDDAALGIPLLFQPSVKRPFVDWAKVERLLFDGYTINSYDTNTIDT